MRTHYNIPKNEDEFEVLCLKLLRRRWKCPQLEQFGKRGERQFGIDLLDLSGADPLHAAQCKLHEPHKSIPPAEIEGEVNKARMFAPPLGIYAIMTTAKVSTLADRKIIEINRRHGEKGLFVVELLNWGRIEELLNEYSDVREEYGSGQVARVEAKLTEIQVSIRSTNIERSSDLYHADIDEAKAALERREFQLAKLLLQRLRQKHWDELTPRQRFRLVSNLGSAWLGEGEVQKAATCLFEAKTYQPEDEKALANEVLAHYITDNLKSAHELAANLRHRFPHSTFITSLWINSAAPTKALSELEADVSPFLLSDAEVAVALSVRALREFNFQRAEELLRGIRSGNMEWSTVPGLLARTILGDELFRQKLKVSNATSERARLQEAKTLFSRAIDLAKHETQARIVSEYLLDRAQIQALMNDMDGSASDIQEAYQLTPSDPAVVAMMAGLTRSRGDVDRAIEMLRQIGQTSRRIDGKYQLASALHGRGKREDNAEAAQVLKELAKEDMPQALRVPIIGMAIDCFVDDGQIAEAESLMDGLSDGYLTPLATHTLIGRLAIGRGDHENARQEAEAALALVTDDSDGAELEYLANLLNQLGRHKDALPLWQRLTKPGLPGSDPKNLLETAARLQRHDVILATCEAFRTAGIERRDLLDYELHVLEQYDIEAAVRVLKEHLSKHSDDNTAQLRLSLIGLRTSNKELICSDPKRMPDVGKITPEGGRAAVQVLKLGGRPDHALKYAYDLLRLNFSEPAAHRAYQFVLMPFGPMPNIVEYETVQIDAAVTYLEDGIGIPHTIVIEQPPQDGRGFSDQIPPDNTLARQMIGKRVGDSFTLAKGTISTRTAKISQILNKYVYRYQESMSQWQVRFPDDSTMESIQVIKQPGDEVDLSGLLASIDRRQEAADKLEEIYKSQPVPIHMLASQFGKNAFQGTFTIASRRGLSLACCAGTQEERSEAVENIKVSGEVVLELTAIATLSLLELEDVLRRLGLSIIVSQDTVAQLSEMIQDEELSTGKGGLFSKIEGRYALIEYSAEEKQKYINALRKLFDVLKSSAKTLPSRELLNMDPERRENLYKAFGQYGTESILLATAPGRVLWTDDHTLARFGAGEYGVRRIWTQVTLDTCAATGKITSSEYLDASAKLLGFEYSFTSSNPSVLMSAARLATWQPNTRPLREALDQFSAPLVDTNQLLRLAVLFGVQLYRESIAPDMRDAIFLQVLDNIYERTKSKSTIEALQKALPRVFGLNLIGLGQISDCVRRWLSRPDLLQ